MYEWLVEKIVNWDLAFENNDFLNYLNSFGSEKISFVQIRTGINFDNLNLAQEEKLQGINIIIDLYKKCKCLEDLDVLIKALLTKSNRTDIENYVIFHLENLYNDLLTLKCQTILEKNSEKVNMILSRSLYLANESLPCSE